MNLLCVLASICLLCMCGVNAGKQEARALRKQGDTALESRDYDAALKFYSDSIDADPTSHLGHYKRSGVWADQASYEGALLDLHEALKIKQWDGGYVRRGTTYQHLGQYEEAAADFRKAIELKPKNRIAKKRLDECLAVISAKHNLDTALAGGNYELALAALDTLSKQKGTKTIDIVRQRCKIYFQSGQYYEVVKDAMTLLKHDKHDHEALLIRAKAFFEIGEVDSAVTHISQCLRSDPEHAECKESMKKIRAVQRSLQAVKDAMAQQQWALAVQKVREALIVTTDAPAYIRDLKIQLCECSGRSGATQAEWDEAVKSCTAAMELENAPESMREWRAEVYRKMGKFQEALNDLNAILTENPNNHNIRQKIAQVQNQKKIAERKDYYKILGVARDASQKDIQRAFRKLAVSLHPDKFKGTKEEEEAVADRLLDINEAYDVMSDPEMRARFDRGEDISQASAHQQHHQHNPFHGFQQQGFRWG